MASRSGRSRSALNPVVLALACVACVVGISAAARAAGNEDGDATRGISTSSGQVGDNNGLGTHRGGTLLTATPTATSTPGCASGWRYTAPPNPSQTRNALVGVAAIGPSDVWAVGNYESNYTQHPLIEHWNGSQWTVVPAPSVGFSDYLYAAAAISSNDVWAVGCSNDGTSNTTALVLHWDGQEWTQAPGPTAGSSWVCLAGIAAAGPNDVWVVGASHDNTSIEYPFVAHWGGSQWTTDPLPSNGYATSRLTGVAIAGPNDVWAVGHANNEVYGVSYHWDGSQWTLVALPTPAPGAGTPLYGVAAGAGDVWAVGSYYTGSGGPRTYILKRNGAAWSLVPSPSAGNFRNKLTGVAIAGPNDVWAAGYYDSTGAYQYKPLTEHWDGQAWVVQNGPDPGPRASYLYAVSAAAPNSVWAVGSTTNLFGDLETLAQYYAGSCATATPTLTGTPTWTPSPTPTGGCSPEWAIVPGRNANMRDNRLYGAAAASATDVWAVGEYVYDAGRSTRGLIQHWDGAGWHVSTVPVTSAGSSLRAAAALSTNDAWVVGYYDDMMGHIRPLFVHWDGSEWTIVPGPTGRPASYLYGIAAIAPDDIWAVGESCCVAFATSETLVMHWDGTAWSIVPSPSVTLRTNRLYSVSAVSPTDVWAVGFSNGTVPERPDTLLLHWDGTSWNQVDSPTNGVFYAVHAISVGNAWAVGYSQFLDTPHRTLAAHWDGAAWNVVPSPNNGEYLNELSGISGTAANDLWAVGRYSYVNGPTRTLAMHWDGATWSIVPTSDPAGQESAHLDAIAALSPANVWAVGAGYSLSTYMQRVLIEHFASPCASTPTPVVTPCTENFTDVDPSDYFYDAVSYMYCRGIISGYSDGTFRPYTPTTRGQLSKIVVLAEGWPIATPTGTPTFRDVPAGNPFYAYIETAYSGGVISGYADGTFRWGNNVTRGQLSKIVVLAGNCPLNTYGGPHFADVAEDNPFYTYIETAYNAGIISGYGDSTFRPGEPATRGQICKIVYNSVVLP